MHKNWWILIVVLILIALGSWWFAATRSFNSATDIATATSTIATTSNQIEQVQAYTATRRGGDVQAIVASLPNASQFQALFNASEESSSFKENGQYTIFVPTDAAFARLAKTTLSKMSAVQKKRLVAYHIVAGQAIQADSEAAGTVRALSGDPLNFTKINNVPMVDSAIILSAYRGTNGVVYVISAVLIPPKK